MRRSSPVYFRLLTDILVSHSLVTQLTAADDNVDHGVINEGARLQRDEEERTPIPLRIFLGRETRKMKMSPPVHLAPTSTLSSSDDCWDSVLSWFMFRGVGGWEGDTCRGWRRCRTASQWRHRLTSFINNPPSHVNTQRTEWHVNTSQRMWPSCTKT